MTKRHLIIRLSSLGDILLTAPMVSNLKIADPDSELYFLCKESQQEAAGLIDGIDFILTIPDSISMIKLLAMLPKFDQYEFYSIFDLQGNIRSWAVRTIVNARYKYVYPKRRLERTLAVKKKKFPEYVPHTIELYHQVLRKIDIPVHAEIPRLKQIEPDMTLLASMSSPYMVIVPEAAHSTKQYPLDRYIDAIQKLQSTTSLSFVWLYLNDNTGQHLQSAPLDNNRNQFVLKASLKEAATIIQHACLTLSNDSGLMHLSSAVATPVIALFGPTHPALGFSPVGYFDVMVQTDDHCRPCSLHGGKPCYREERFCFTRISSDRVANVVKHHFEQDYKKSKAVFFDRDGTIIKDKHYLSDPEQIEFENGALEGMRTIQEKGYKIIILSNQSGVGRGKFGIAEVEAMNRRLNELLIKEHIYPDAIYYCPHHPEGSNPEFANACRCRKPSPAMAEEAISQFHIDPLRSFVIGDKPADVQLAKVIGARPILVTTGYGSKSKTKISGAYYKDTRIVKNLTEAAQHIS